MTAIDASSQISHEISQVRRSVGTRLLEAGEARVMTVSRVYPTNQEDLWDACTNPERIPRWFLPVSGDLRPGGRYQLEGNAEGTVEECDPPRRFSATWEFGGEVSWIEVEISDEGDGQARFTLEHVAHVSDERWAQFGPGATGVGWELGLLGLSLHLASGSQQVDPGEFEAWVVSEDGRRIVEGISAGWRDASVAAGTDPAEAEAAAERTTGFYTGT